MTAFDLKLKFLNVSAVILVTPILIAAVVVYFAFELVGLLGAGDVYEDQ